MDVLLQRYRRQEGRFGIGRVFCLGLTWGRFMPPIEDGMLVFRGEENPVNIDYDEPVGSRIGTGDVEITHLVHTADTKYYYGCRQVSKYGRIEENLDVVTEVQMLTDGTMAGERPDMVTEPGAQAVEDGKIEVRFQHRVLIGTEPVKFNIYYDQGNGPLEIDMSDGACLVGTVTYRGDNRYNLKSGALSNGTEYWFCITAEDTDGNESRPSELVAARADSAGPGATAGITIATRL